MVDRATQDAEHIARLSRAVMDLQADIRKRDAELSELRAELSEVRRFAKAYKNMYAAMTAPKTGGGIPAERVWGKLSDLEDYAKEAYSALEKLTTELQDAMAEFSP